MPATSIFSLLPEYDVSQLSVEFAEGRYVNVYFQATAGNSIPGLYTRMRKTPNQNRIFSFFIPFPIPWGVIISKRSTEIIS